LASRAILLCFSDWDDGLLIFCCCNSPFLFHLSLD
jgi:hypothetical protein